MDTSTPPADSQVPDSTAPDRSTAVTSPIPPPELGAILPRRLVDVRGRLAGVHGRLLGAAAAAYLILQLLTVILASFNVVAGEPEITPVLEFIQFLGKFLIPAWLWIGQTLAFLKIARREPTTLEDLFRGLPWLLTLLLATGPCWPSPLYPACSSTGRPRRSSPCMGGMRWPR